MDMALDNSNTCIGYKLAFYRYMYSIDIYRTSKFSIKKTLQLKSIKLSDLQEKKRLICLLVDVKKNYAQTQSHLAVNNY